MVLEIDINNLVNKLLNCEEFCILQLLYKKQYTLLQTYYQKFPSSTTDTIEGLVAGGYILSSIELIDYNNFENIILNKSKIEEALGLKKEDTPFYTFFSTYPQKVPSRGGGYRALRPANVDGKQAEVLKKKYFSKVGKIESFQKKVQSILELELEHRKKSNSLIYLPAMEVYLNGYKWESYEYLLNVKTTTQNAEPKKGERLI